MSMFGGSPNGNLRQEEEDRQRLEKANFDLKMRVHYLENHLKRATNGEQYDSTTIDIASLTYQLDEKTAELEQRNMLLAKARVAIEGLKSELDKYRSDHKERQNEVEQRIQLIRGSYEKAEDRYKEQLSDLENQLLESRLESATKDHIRTELEERLVRRR
jgi:Tfp pilus assembly protein PilN